jgi:murein DD-endopeptidase MepM/ murein hydrolase activator NlpD
MLYATDIIRIENTNPEWIPEKNEDYPVFNQNIYSPIEGYVVKVIDNIPDNEPFSEDFPYNTGNTVVIQQNDLYMLLGHMKKGSIVVKVGDNIHSGDLIGSVGNSGWTERPHTHMQLMKSKTTKYWSGIGIQIRFENRNLYKNRIIKN